MNQNYIPQEVVSEFLGYFTLAGPNNIQVMVSEQIASNYYRDLDELIDTIEGYSPSLTFRQQVEQAKKSDFFKPYFSN